MCFVDRCSESVSLRLAAVAIVLTALLPAAVPGADAETVRLSGTLTALHVEDAADRLSAGSVAVDARTVVVPRTLPLDVAGVRLTIHDVFANAPMACRRANEIDLSASGVCRSAFDEPTPDQPPTTVRVVATRGADGNLVASEVTFDVAHAPPVGERARSNPTR